MVRQWLRYPRGRYSAARASQLSGVPKTTVYDWAKNGIVVPDLAGAKPMQWTYRDLVFLRLMAWLRAHDMPRDLAADRLSGLRRLLERGRDTTGTTVRSDGTVFLVDADEWDKVTGVQMIAASLFLVPEFDLTASIEVPEFGRTRLWGPNLLHPSPRSSISPWVMAGDPCVRETRIPTATVLALRTERGLGRSAIRDLYPVLDGDDVDDALELEERLRRIAA
jgi:uncharacterized protein (DUF433 family)